VGNVRGAFPTTVDALNDAAPIIAFGRPYTPDLFGWFDDFSTTGPYDAEGGFSRAQIVFNISNITQQVPELIDIGQRDQVFGQLAKTGQYRRCPGASEEPAPDGSNVFSNEEQQALDCVEADRATGPSP
jgi:hypothetical protein